MGAKIEVRRTLFWSEHDPLEMNCGAWPIASTRHATVLVADTFALLLVRKHMGGSLN